MSDFTRDRLVLIATEPPFGVGDLAINLAAFALALLDRVDEWEKVFGHIDKDPDTAGNKIIEARREIEAERDRLREENKSLREANEIDLGEKAPLIFENAELKARNEILREELREAEEVIRYVSMTDVNDCFLPNGHEMKGAYGFRGFLGDWYAYPRRMQAAVRRARERGGRG